MLGRQRRQHFAAGRGTIWYVPCWGGFEVGTGGTPPFRSARSAASLFALYSILFCSKLGSRKYSSSAPAKDTGAYSIMSM